jgi:hypothetical protein
MTINDFTAPDVDLLVLVTKRADLADLPAEGTTRAEAFLDFLAIVDDLRGELAACEKAWLAGLADLGVCTKRCRECGDRFAINGTGRPADYCSTDCRASARRGSGPAE